MNLSQLGLSFHDATLLALRLDWATGDLVLELRTSAQGGVCITAAATTSLVVPRFNPWGPSVSVNAVSEEVHLTSGSRLSIEMQSGDVIKVEASSFSVTRERSDRTRTDVRES